MLGNNLAFRCDPGSNPGPLSYNAHGGILSLISENTTAPLYHIYLRALTRFTVAAELWLLVDHGDA